MKTTAMALLVICWPVWIGEASVAGGEAQGIREATGVDTGLAVVIAPDVQLACDLAEEGRLLVHLLSAKPQAADGLREAVGKRGLGGRVVVGTRAAAGHLPYPDRFVNLLVADLDALGDRAPAAAELRRVLGVRGASYFKRGGKWRAATTPADDRLDGWSHRFYDATGNCVSRDRLAAIPQAVQWQHGPAMEDGTSDGKTIRIADGRVLAPDNATGDLVCRDAGNGAMLWRAALGMAGNEDFAVVDGRVYLYHDAKADAEKRRRARWGIGPLVALDLATGRVGQTYDQSLRAGTAKPIEWQTGGRRRRESPVPWFVVGERAIVQAYGADLVVLDRKTGRRLWHKTLEGATWFSPVVSGELVLAAEAAVPARRGRHDGTAHVRAVTAFAAVDGRARWRNESVHPTRTVKLKDQAVKSRAEFKPISAADGLVLLHVSSYQFRYGGSVAVLDARDGRELWRQEFQPGELYTQGSQRAVLRGGEVILLDGKGARRWAARTGKPIGEPLRGPRIRRGARGNGACTASRATARWLFCNAYLFVGPDYKASARFGTRGACGQGLVPGNGMLFAAPTPCDCGDYTRGYQGFAPSVPGRPIGDDARLTRGEKAPAPTAAKAPWPTFLGDRLHPGCAAADLPDKLQQRWRVTIAAPRNDWLAADRRQSERYLGPISAPVVGAGLVVVAAGEAHRVVAVDAATGTRRWAYTAGGKVDSPPTLAAGLAVFGCQDGAVYALRLGDGQLVWRFRAAPTDGVAMLHGHLGSAFPLPGSVLVLGGTVLAVAGVHTDIGGLHVWALDLRTGQPRAGRVIRHDQPAVITNGLLVPDEDGRGFWLGTGVGGSRLHLSLALKDLPHGRGPPGPQVTFDRNGALMRFRTNDRRGGSTHGWKGAMRLAGKNHRLMAGHRMVGGARIAYGLSDPRTRDRRGDSSPVIWAARRDAEQPLWRRSWKDLVGKESYGALLQAGRRLYAAGGARNGSSGFVQTLDAATGKLLSTHVLPARVTECGLAAAGGRLYVACEDGALVCLAGGQMTPTRPDKTGHGTPAR